MMMPNNEQELRSFSYQISSVSILSINASAWALFRTISFFCSWFYSVNTRNKHWYLTSLQSVDGELQKMQWKVEQFTLHDLIKMFLFQSNHNHQYTHILAISKFKHTYDISIFIRNAFYMNMCSCTRCIESWILVSRILLILKQDSSQIQHTSCLPHNFKSSDI